MRKIHKQEDEFWETILHEDGLGQSERKITKEEVDALVASGEADLYETVEEILVSEEYKQKRRSEYPYVGEQLDQIFHEGIDAWKETIQAVKDANPKPE